MKVFYQDYTIDQGIESNDPREANLSLALEIFYELTDDENNFFGIEDSEERCIQFFWISQDKWLVDIPKPPDFINYQKYADYDECIEMIKRVYELNEVVQFAGMIKVDIMNESLDDKLGI